MTDITHMPELSLDQLDQVSGGDFTLGATGPIVYGSTPEGGTFVSWPGQVGGQNGSWTMNSKSGLVWQRA